MEYIFEIDDVVSKEFCKDVILRFEMDERKNPGTTITGLNEKIKKSIDLYINNPSLHADWRDVNDKVGECVIKALHTYRTELMHKELDMRASIYNTINNCKIGLPQIQKTEKDGFHTWHHDAYLNRLLTYIIYLNDVEEGVGGTTEFLCGKTIQPKAGKILIFPASLTYIHRGNTLRDGVKYILTNFIYNGPPIHEHLRMKELEPKTLEEEIPKPENDEI